MLLKPRLDGPAAPPVDNDDAASPLSEHELNAAHAR